MVSSVRSPFASLGKLAHPLQLVPIEEETAWRRSTQLAAPHGPVVAIGRWSERRGNVHELSAQALTEHHTVEVLLEETFVECFKNGRNVYRGAALFGGTQITAPGQDIRCCFARSSEAIHLFLPNNFVVTAYEEVYQEKCPSEFQFLDPRFEADPVMGRLAGALANASALHGPCAVLYFESLSLAAVARLMQTQVRPHKNAPTRAGLAPWRLRRAVEYIEASLEESITLANIAEHTGLSRMHFATQFRRSTGLSPHAFLLCRRLEKAKQIMRNDSSPLAQVALAAGFTSQSHFTAVFRKLTGTTPGRWRAQTGTHARYSVP